MKITIIGAGIGGLTAGIALLRKGFDVTILEQASELKEIGAGVQLSANATGVLYRLGLGPALEAIASEPIGKRVRLWNTGQIWPLFDLGANSRLAYGYPYFTLHRADLHAALANEVMRLKPDAIKLGVRVTGNVQHAGGVTISAANGAVYESAIAIRADGVHSGTRESQFGPDAPRYSGVMAWRGVIKASDLPERLRAPYGTNWVGPGAHVIQYPLRNGELINFVGAVEGNRWEVESWSERGTHEECLGDFKGWHEDVHTLIKAIDVPYKWVLKVRDPMPVWTKGNVTLLGDACHPTLPFLAQGAGMAIEDGYILARALAMYPDSPATAFASYENARHERTAKVVIGSAANTKRFHNPALADAQGAAEYVEREWNEERVRERYEWLFNYDVDAVAL
ncbi:FAD-dependent monooxygenase [Massilia soli]|uniref:FAD-dependent monooxygenase n=1 Tax=Massilia soli TaxID=2792854 RepID=A0ABS7ST81_9BURK|nr:FAD-dependent monooxygenase [Massilia soli]MBZ2209168.1 FAD-dependent monooxygenase [Massilia soli]